MVNSQWLTFDVSRQFLVVNKLNSIVACNHVEAIHHCLFTIDHLPVLRHHMHRYRDAVPAIDGDGGKNNLCQFLFA